MQNILLFVLFASAAVSTNLFAKNSKKRLKNPVAKLKVSPRFCKSPCKVKIDASKSKAFSGKKIKKYYFFVDGKEIESESPILEYTLTHYSSKFYENYKIFPVKIKVIDSAYKYAYKNSEIKVKASEENSPPAASFDFSPTAGKAPLLVNLDASSSFDPNDMIIDYEWKISNGVELKGVNPEYTFETQGVYEVRLVTTDLYGGYDVITKSITVSAPNIAPVTNISLNQTQAEVPFNLVIDASASSDSDGEIVSYQFNLSNGESIFSTVPVINYTVTSPGDLSISVVTTDNDHGQSSATASFTGIDASNLPPDPGEQGKRTLAGVDSNDNGVRDDVERFIASISEPTPILESLNEFARITQRKITEYENREQTIQNTFDEISYDYCLRSQLSDEKVAEYKRAIFIEQHNTKERILAWARGQRHFAGQVVFSETDESRFSEFCNYRE